MVGTFLTRDSANRLINSLDEVERERYAPYFERVQLSAHQRLFSPDEPHDYLWFPESGVCSQVIESSDGRSVEVGIIGREGIVGLPAVFGVSLAAAQGVAQMDLSALRIRVTDFHEHLSANRALLSRTERYAAVRFGCLAQTAACNRLHRTHQRLCRWLLLVRDLAGSNELPITHEFLGLMLGARRASVSEAAAELQARGLIRYEPGMLHYLDVAGVEELACECYGIIRRLHETL